MAVFLAIHLVRASNGIVLGNLFVRVELKVNEANFILQVGQERRRSIVHYKNCTVQRRETDKRYKYGSIGQPRDMNGKSGDVADGAYPMVKTKGIEKERTYN